MADQPTVSRRVILRGAVLIGAAGVVLRLEGAEPSLPWDGQPAGGAPMLQLRQTPTFTKVLYRREDQLFVRLEFYNLRLLKKGQAGPGDVQQARLVTVDPTAPAFLVADLGPQHLAEHAYNVVTGEPVAVPTRSMLAGSSRLAFLAPATPIPYTFEALMAWDGLAPSLVPHAVGAATVRAPLPTETAVELPWKVVLSPGLSAKWTHALATKVGPTNRALLWHTRLTPTSGPSTAPTTARVVWTPDLENAPVADPAVPGVTSLDPDERRKLVRLTAQWNQSSGTAPYVPKPVDIAELALSSHGGWLAAKGTWDVRPNGVDLKEWVHRATAGRDQFVRTVDAGRLFPLGHRVELVTLTQRVMEATPSGTFKAVLRQRSYIDPRQRERTFHDGDVPFAPNGLRDLPFKKIRILNPVTPDLAPYGQNPEPGTNVPPANGLPAGTAFWPRVGAPGNWADFLWDIEAEDFDGRISRFALPLIYVSETYGTSGNVGPLRTYYEGGAGAARRTADLGGQRVAMAAFAGGAAGETAYPLASLEFGANTFIVGVHPVVPPYDFTPRMVSGTARLDAVDRIKGGAAGPPRTITLHPQWISAGDSAAVNPGRVFAFLPVPVDLSFAANASGGVATPSMKISALSATTGPIDAPSVKTTAPTSFKPADFFQGGAPMIFGTIPLTKILKEVAFPAGPGSGPPPVPRLVKTDLVEGQTVVGFHTALAWDTDVVSIAGLFLNNIPNGPAARLTLAAAADAYVDGRPASSTISGELTNFTVQAVGPLHVIDVMFNRFGFVAKDNHKPDMKVSIHDVAFVGALAFVNVLRQYMGGDGLGGSPSPAALSGPKPAPAKALQAAQPPANGGYVNVSVDGVQVGVNLTLPPVPCGVLLMENISFGARADLFFDGRPMRLRFNFAERNQPFLLTVMCFGGGGAMAVTFGLDDFELFELTLEFGAKLALDIGVASGSISAMAGIYLAIGDTDGDGQDDGTRLTGFLRLNGELDVLGIVSMSVEFYLAFTYISDPRSVYGEAKVTVEIDVLFFSGSVTLGPIKKTFAGGDGGGSANALASAAPSSGGKALVGKLQLVTADQPATFTAMTSAAQWTEYTNLFASAAF